MKKITSLVLAVLLVLGMMPIGVHAEEKTVITEINAYFDFTLPSYGDKIDRTSFDITVEGDIPVTLSSVGFDWYINRNGENISIWDGYFTDGMWCFDLKVELNDTDNYTFDEKNGTTLKINDSVWATDIKCGGWVYSPYYEIQHIPGEFTLALFSPALYKVPISYIGKAITPIDFSIGALGGTKPYVFSKSSGADWLQISEDGILSGTPIEEGENEQICITVTDALGAKAYLDLPVGKTYMNPDDRTVISRVEATVELPEFYCGYTRTTEYDCIVTVGSPAVVRTASSDFYPLDKDGNIGSATKTIHAGKYIMDVMVAIENEEGRTHVLDEDNLEVIINGKAATFDFVNVFDDSSYLWVNLPEFTVDHVFDNDTDATCNGCDFTREGCDHQYENPCDSSCNVCGATRVTEHQYDAVCDDECNVCEGKRVAEPHAFDNCNDGYCNFCSVYRSVPSHTYDDCKDGVCNVCEEARNIPAHRYTNYWDTTCDSCGESRIINTIALNEKKTAMVEFGGMIIEYVFTPSITGEFVFEAFASSDTCGYVFDENEEQLWYNDDGGLDNQFKIQQTFVAGKTYILKVKFYSTDVTGEIPFSIVCVHDFTDVCDSECGICEFVREAPHSYDNAADKQCNECPNVRPLNFIGINETKTVEITRDNEYVDFVFIPEVSGKYFFIGLGDESQDTFAKLFDSEENLLASNDEAGGNHQFKITYDMEAGKPYILRACFYSSSFVGTFSVLFNCEHAYDDEYDADCNVCGFIREAKKDVNVIAKCDIDFTVLGNVITVDNQLACKVGYIEGEGYLNVVGTKNADGTYSFIVPEGVSDVILVVKGDVSADASVDSTDYLRIKGHFLETYAFDDANFFAADVKDDGVIDSTDYLRIKGHFLETYDLHD